jgi:hypothetical protein
MGELSWASQTVQLGKETTPGTAVAANKKPASMSITGGIAIESEEFVAAGNKYPSFVIPGREWAKWKIGGRATYGELPYLLASILKTVTATSDTTTGKKWVFAPALAAEDAITTYTLERGSSDRAQQAPYFLVTELGFKFTRSRVEIDGAAISQRLVDGVTLTGTPTAMENPPVPVLGSQLSIKFADSWAGLDAASAATRILECDWKIGGRFDQLWVLDSSKTSFVTHVEDTPKVGGNVIMQANAAGMAYLDVMRNATQKWMRIAAVGAEIESGKPYLFQIDGCYNISQATEFTANQKTTAIGWTFTPVYDATAGKTFEVTVRNKLAAL